MKPAVAVRASLLLLWFAFGLVACGKPDEPAVEARAEATPSPSPFPTPEQDAVATASEKLKHKTDNAIKSLTGFLHNEDPRFQAKLQKLADKVARNKDKLRKQFQKERDALQPQIEQLKAQVARAEGKNQDDVNRQLDDLKAQSQDWEKKLKDLANASGDELKKLKAGMKDAEAKADASPTP